MTRANKALAMLVVAALGLWGCAKGPANGAANAERIRALESKCAKLEEDYRAAASTRDTVRKKLTEVEEQRGKLRVEVEQLQPLVKEQEVLKQQLDVRTVERDAVQAQFEAFRKHLRDLVGQADAAVLSTPGQPSASAADGPVMPKS
jgi:septal ring factor EnvC (AmiA/AmiB activator)